MIITKLEGGLGNQMFQYVVGRLLARQNNDQLLLDHSYFLHLSGDPKITKYQYSLGVFPAIKERAATVFDYWLLAPMMVPLLARRWEQLYNFWRLGRFQIVHEQQGQTFDPTLLQRRGHVFLQGFWQHPQYPQLIENEVRKAFVFAPKIQSAASRKIQSLPKGKRVSVHVRRGDYLAIGLGVCSVAYYRNAHELLQKKLKKPHYVILSNDIAWAKKNLQFLSPAIFVDPATSSEAIDLCIISQCDHHIIANSTFSWWGAWLNPQPRKIVIAPQPWFDWEGMKHLSPVPSNWITLPK